MTTETMSVLPDYRVEGGGTVYLVRAMNQAALDNLKEGVSDEAQWMGRAVAVEHRYIVPLVEQLRAEGWEVR